MTDPLDALRAPSTPLDPDPDFAADLRERVLRALLTAPIQEETMTDVLLRDGLSRNGTRAGDVSYIALGLPDLARGRAFYGAVLGWRFAPGRVAGNQVDDVIPQVGLWEGNPVQRAVLAYRVEDLDVAVAAVRAHGGTAGEPHREPYGLAADCVDDRGVEFSLHQLPPPGRPVAENGARAGDVSYVSLLVPDGDAARAFYGAVLGWQFAGGSPQGVTPMIGIGGRDRRLGAQLCFRVDDIQAAVARVRSAGGTADDPVRRSYAQESLCADDQGTEFYLHQFSG